MHRILAPSILLLCSSNLFAASPVPTRDDNGSYPLSCLEWPLPQIPTGPTVTAYGTLPTLTDVQEYAGTEGVKFVFWRTPCVGGMSALLVQTSRTGDTSVNSVEWFSDPGIVVEQNGTSAFARLALEPNTRYSSLKFDTVIKSSLTMVFENTEPGDPTQLQSPTAFDFNQALTVYIPNAAAIGLDPPPPPITVSIPAYDEAQYADATPTPTTKP